MSPDLGTWCPAVNHAAGHWFCSSQGRMTSNEFHTPSDHTSACIINEDAPVNEKSSIQVPEEVNTRAPINNAPYVSLL